METLNKEELVTVEFEGWTCFVKLGQYENGRTSISLMDIDDGCPVARATSNIPHAELEENETLIKDYSENEGMLNSLIETGLVKYTGKNIKSGWIELPVVTILFDANNTFNHCLLKTK